MIVIVPERNRPAYDFSDPVNLKGMTGGDPLFAGVVATPAFQRLKSIRFLGGIDYLLVRAPNGVKGNIRYTRYQHSLGVARLALHYCQERGLSSSERRLVYVAALLHDVGHAPLSHSLEPVFDEIFGLEHHRIEVNWPCKKAIITWLCVRDDSDHPFDINPVAAQQIG